MKMRAYNKIDEVLFYKKYLLLILFDVCERNDESCD